MFSYYLLKLIADMLSDITVLLEKCFTMIGTIEVVVNQSILEHFLTVANIITDHNNVKLIRYYRSYSIIAINRHVVVVKKFQDDRPNGW